jgi:hypothetical protein
MFATLVDEPIDYVSAVRVERRERRSGQNKICSGSQCR